MFRWHGCVVSIVVLIVASSGGLAVAQSSHVHNQQSSGTSAKPPSSVGGYTGSELQSIYRRDIGQGYTVDSIIRESLRSANAGAPYMRQSVRGSSGSLGLSPPRAGKPFSGISSSPTVSPYLNLFRESLDGNDDLNYNTLVRPQLEQQRMNEQFQRQNLDISRRVQAIAAQADYNPQGSKSQYPTGHQTTFMYYGHYYPAAAPQRGR